MSLSCKQQTNQAQSSWLRCFIFIKIPQSKHTNLFFIMKNSLPKKIKMKNAYKCTPLNITENVLFHLKPLFISRSYFKFDFKLRLSEPICVIYLCLYLYLFFISSLFSPFVQNRMWHHQKVVNLWYNVMSKMNNH